MELNLQEVSKSFKGNKVADNIDMNLDKGVHGLLGQMGVERQHY